MNVSLEMATVKWASFKLNFSLRMFFWFRSLCNTGLCGLPWLPFVGPTGGRGGGKYANWRSDRGRGLFLCLPPSCCCCCCCLGATDLVADYTPQPSTHLHLPSPLRAELFCFDQKSKHPKGCSKHLCGSGRIFKPFLPI